MELRSLFAIIKQITTDRTSSQKRIDLDFMLSRTRQCTGHLQTGTSCVWHYDLQMVVFLATTFAAFLQKIMTVTDSRSRRSDRPHQRS
jgi:hypothetical protein